MHEERNSPSQVLALARSLLARRVFQLVNLSQVVGPLLCVLGEGGIPGQRRAALGLAAVIVDLEGLGLVAIECSSGVNAESLDRFSRHALVDSLVLLLVGDRGRDASFGSSVGHC